MPERDIASGKRSGDIDEALVSAAAETQRGVALALDEGSVDKYIDPLHEFFEQRFLHQLFPCETCIDPHIEFQFALDTLEQLLHGLMLEERVTSAQCERGIVLGYDLKLSYDHLAVFIDIDARFRRLVFIADAFDRIVGVIIVDIGIDGADCCWGIGLLNE